LFIAIYDGFLSNERQALIFVFHLGSSVARLLENVSTFVWSSEYQLGNIHMPFSKSCFAVTKVKPPFPEEGFVKALLADFRPIFFEFQTPSL